MSTDVTDQIRRLVESYDDSIDAITVDEIVGRRSAVLPSKPDDPIMARPVLPVVRVESARPARRRRRLPALGLVAASVAVAAGVIGGVGWSRHTTVPGSGGQPASTTTPPLTGSDGALTPTVAAGSTPTTQFVEQDDGDAALGPLDFVGTIRPLPRWPQRRVSDPPALTSGIGMGRCSDGAGTKIVSLDSDLGAEYLSYGTLCLFVTLTEARPDAVTTCASMSDGTHYARCQHRTDATDATGAGGVRDEVAPAGSSERLAALPQPTSPDPDLIVAPDVAAADRSGPALQTDRVTVTFGPGDEDHRLCFRIELADATADGCVGDYLLATGLAYVALQDRTGDVDLVGIVPDAVTGVTVGDVAVPISDNVWHLTLPAGHHGDLTVTTADGASASTGT